MNKFVQRLERIYGANDKSENDNYIYINKEGYVGIIVKPVVNKAFKKGISLIDIVHRSETVFKTLILTDEEKKIKTTIDADTFTLITTNFPEIRHSCFIPNDSTAKKPMPFLGQLDEEYYIVVTPSLFNRNVSNKLASETI